MGTIDNDNNNDNSSIMRPRFSQKFQLSGIFEISKKVRNTIFACTKKLMFPGYLFFIFFKILEKNFMVFNKICCVFPKIHQLWSNAHQLVL